jgi:hypothetical protein
MGGNGISRASTQTFNTLTLTANSSIDFANLGGQSTLFFGKIAGLSSYTLSIFNYNGTNLWGTTSTTGGIGQYTMFFALAGPGASSLSATELNNIRFYSGSDANSAFLGEGSFSNNTTNGFNQIIPVPEPAVALSALPLLSWMLLSFRTQLSVAVRGLFSRLP